mmetsp:Transcript_6234/g.17800  ORF Transcript_6234/g.17800 Transcript_6234/m.17800 type:complete len:212 (-) Transcript_6234:80-715(-)
MVQQTLVQLEARESLDVDAGAEGVDVGERPHAPLAQAGNVLQLSEVLLLQPRVEELLDPLHLEERHAAMRVALPRAAVARARVVELPDEERARRIAVAEQDSACRLVARVEGQLREVGQHRGLALRLCRRMRRLVRLQPRHLRLLLIQGGEQPPHVELAGGRRPRKGRAHLRRIARAILLLRPLERLGIARRCERAASALVPRQVDRAQKR